MKKLITSTAFAFLTSFVITTTATAQDIAYSAQPAYRMKLRTLPQADEASLTLSSTTDNLINSSTKSKKEVRKAAREVKQFNRLSKNFEQEFKGASNVKWTKQTNGYSGLFFKDGLRNVVWYSKAGYLAASMVCYTEEKLPNDVKQIVKDAYEGYKISGINEVHKDGITVYVVTIENEKNIKLVTVCDGEMNIYKDLRKG